MRPNSLSIASASSNSIALPSAPSQPMLTCTTPPIRTAAPTEQKYITAAMILAFNTDPVIRWLYPDSHQYLTHFPELVRILGKESYAHHSVYAIDGYAGAALWFPPGVRPPVKSLVELLQHSVFEAQQEDLWTLLEQLQQQHIQSPHWHLSLLAVEPIHQQKGYGSALVQAVLAQCDRDCLPAYVEVSQLAQLPLFKQHGFELLNTLQVGKSPPVFPMIRAPKAGAE